MGFFVDRDQNIIMVKEKNCVAYKEMQNIPV